MDTDGLGQAESQNQVRHGHGNESGRGVHGGLRGPADQKESGERPIRLS